MKDSEILRILRDFNLEIYSMFKAAFRYIFFSIIKLLNIVLDGMENATSELFFVNKFANSEKVRLFISNYKFVFWVLFVIGIAIIGYKVMFSKTKKGEDLIINILIAILILTSMSFLTEKISKITTTGVDAIEGNFGDYISTEKGKMSYGEEIISVNLTDVVYLDKKGFNVKNGDKKNNIKSPKNIEINEKIDTSSKLMKNSKFKDVYEKKIIKGENGEDILEDTDNNIVMDDEGYFRYNIDWIPLLITTLVITLTLILTSLKLGVLMYELAFHQFLAMLVAPIDIADGQKTKKIIEGIINIFIVVILISGLLKIYMMFIPFVSNRNNFSLIPGLILMIAGSKAVIDGPNIIERIFGIDAGVQSMFKTALVGYTGAKIAGGLAGKFAKMTAKGAYAGGKFGYEKYNEMKNKDESGGEDNNGIYNRNKEDEDNKAGGIHAVNDNIKNDENSDELEQNNKNSIQDEQNQNNNVRENIPIHTENENNNDINQDLNSENRDNINQDLNVENRDSINQDLNSESRDNINQDLNVENRDSVNQDLNSENRDNINNTNLGGEEYSQGVYSTDSNINDNNNNEPNTIYQDENNSISSSDLNNIQDQNTTSPNINEDENIETRNTSEDINSNTRNSNINNTDSNVNVNTSIRDRLMGDIENDIED